MLKRGLSRIVVNLLIILLILIVAGTIWFVVRNNIQGGSEQNKNTVPNNSLEVVKGNVKDDSTIVLRNDAKTNEQSNQDELRSILMHNILGNFTLDLAIPEVKIINDSMVIVTVKRYQDIEGDEKYLFTGILFLLYGDNKAEIFRENYPLPELGTIRIQLPLTLINSSEITEISIFPILVDNSGKEFVGSVQDLYVFPTGSKKIEQKGTGEECIQANIIATKVICSDTGCEVSLSRQSGDDDIKGVKLLFTDKAETISMEFDEQGNIGYSETKTANVMIFADPITRIRPNLNKVEVIPYFSGMFGNDKLCKGSSQLSF